MKKAFSLFELIIVLIVVSILATFIIIKSSDSLDYSNKTKIKSEIALIRNALTKKQTSNTLLNNQQEIVLDDALINKKDNELFENILDITFLSTTIDEKVNGKWIKTAENTYKTFLDEDTNLEFKYENKSFLCKSEISLCKEFE